MLSPTDGIGGTSRVYYIVCMPSRHLLGLDTRVGNTVTRHSWACRERFDGIVVPHHRQEKFSLTLVIPIDRNTYPRHGGSGEWPRRGSL